MPKAKPTTKAEPKKVAKKLSDTDQLAADLKAHGCDSVRVWRGDDNGLVYARMTKDGRTRLLSVSEDQLKRDAAKTLYTQSGL